MHIFVYIKIDLYDTIQYVDIMWIELDDSSVDAVNQCSPSCY